MSANRTVLGEQTPSQGNVQLFNGRPVTYIPPPVLPPGNGVHVEGRPVVTDVPPPVVPHHHPMGENAPPPNAVKQAAAAPSASAARQRKSGGAASGAAPRARAKAAAKTQPLDVSGVDLGPGRVKVLDTCSEIRRKLRLVLKKDGVTQAGLLRALTAQHPDGAKVAASSLRAFIEKKNPMALDGCGSCVYPAAYVLFEKMRLRDGKPKTEHRLGMERVWEARGGVPTDGPVRTPITHVSEVWYMDTFGEIIISRRY